MTDSKTLRSKLIKISSEDKTASSTSNSDFTISLPSDGGNISRVAKILVKSIACPNVFYNVRAVNGTLYVNNTTTPASYSLAIAEGQYTSTQLIAAIEAAFLAATSVAVTITVGATTGKMTWTFASDEWLLVSTGNNNIANTIGLTSDTATASSIAVMPAIVDLNGISEVYVHSRTLASGNLAEPDGSFNVVDILPMTAAFGNMAHSQFVDGESHTIHYRPFGSHESLTSIDIRLRNKTGERLVLPANHNFIMIIKVFY